MNHIEMETGNRGTHDDMMYNDDDDHSQFIHPFRCNGRFTCFIGYRSDFEDQKYIRSVR